VKEPSAGVFSWAQAVDDFLSRQLRRSWPGMIAGTVITLILGQIYVASLGKTVLGVIPGILLYVLATILTVAAAGLILWAGLWFLQKLPKLGVLCMIAVFVALVYLPYAIWYWIVALGGVVGGLVGLALYRGLRRPVSLGLLAAAISLVAATAWWLFSPGDDSYLARPNADSAPVMPLTLPSPAERGPLAYDYLTYGSGTDLRRPEFGSSVAIRTSTVDASAFLPPLGKWRQRERWSYWGFDEAHLPLNGRVWFPKGPGPYPLVMVVHGNHPMWEYSDSGYAWLGEHLASHGFIVVSIDANFLNFSVASDYGQEENFARTLLLFQHLALWKQFSSVPSSRFAGKVDFGNIALIGHSRGGQAVTTAAGFNRLSAHPENGNIPFDFNYNIKTIISIAPMDPYAPSGSLVPLSNINFLTLYGGHDAQAPGFWGLRPYYRIKYTGDGYYCKASAYLYRGNHAAFNTAWGNDDFRPLLGWLLNHKPVIPPSDQRNAAAAFITAFLKGTLTGQTAYLDFMRDSRRGRGWLPEDLYVTQFEDSRFRLIADFSEDLDPVTTTLPDGTIRYENFGRVSENMLSTRAGDSTGQKVVYLGWDRSDWKDHTPALLPQYSVYVPKSFPQEGKFGGQHRVSFILCNANEGPTVLNLSVEVEDDGGQRVRLPLQQFATIHPPLISKISKGLYDFGARRNYELAPQTFELPMKDFVSINPQFDPARLSVIRFVFDQSPRGEILLGRIGIAAPE
jgi:dienelactone hydrolase